MSYLIRNFARILTTSLLELSDDELKSEIDHLRGTRVVEISRPPKKKKPAQARMVVDGKQIVFRNKDGSAKKGRMKKEDEVALVLGEMVGELDADQLGKLQQLLMKKKGGRKKKANV